MTRTAQRTLTWRFAALALGLCLSASSGAQSLWEGYLDGRLIAADSLPSWQQGGLGKQGVSEPDATRLAHAVLVWRQAWSEHWTSAVVLNGNDQRPGAVDLTEAVLTWRDSASSGWRQRFRVGAFFPALSEENSGLGWTAPDSISNSAINAWIGEEVRQLGLEWTLSGPAPALADTETHVSLALFGGNDPAGSLLAWRGWSLGDSISGLHERLPLADLPVFQAGASLPQQAAYVDPFREIDQRIGLSLHWRLEHASGRRIGLLWYDNRADQSIVRDGQYAWATRFVHLGGSLPFGEQWELSGQWMLGETGMGPDHALAVDNAYRASYLRLRRSFGDHALSARWDRFAVFDRDQTHDDDNPEHGQAWMLNYQFSPWEQNWSLLLEYLDIRSERPARRYFGDAAQQREQSLSLSFRWRFG